MIDSSPWTTALFAAVAAFLRETAETITEPAAHNAREQLRITQKPDGTIVTQADREAEAFLTEKLTALLPDSQVLGEETAGDWRTSPLLQTQGDVWIIDPIDGTKPFSKGGAYGIMVGLQRRQRLEAAWIYCPHTKDMLFARHDGPAYHVTELEDKAPVFTPVMVPQREQNAVGLTYYCPPHGEALGPYAPVGALFTRCELCGCIATDVRNMLLEGTPAIFFCGHFSPWDHHITRLIVERAGGSVCYLRDPSLNLDGPTGAILAPNAALRDAILKATGGVSTVQTVAGWL